MNKVKILFPPQFEPFQPYLSLPYLKSLLLQYGIKSKYYDANIDFYLWLFASLRKKLLSNSNERKTHLYNQLDKALSLLKTQNVDLIKYKWAINIIDGYLSEISPEGTNISLSGMEIGNRYLSEDIKDYIGKPDNLFFEFFEQYRSNIFEDNATHYFFSLVVIDQLPASLSIAKKIKELNPNAKIIFGGAAIARYYKRLINNSFICSIVDILNPNEGYKAITEIFDIKEKYEGHITPDYSELDLDKYLSSDIVLPYLVAHGCKWGRCTFCSHHLSYEGYRSSTIDEVINDLSYLKKKYNIDYISFSDEYLTHHQLEELSNKLINKKINIKWSTFTRAEAKFVKNDFTKRLYQAGARVLYFGFETIDQRLLNLMDKGNNAKLYVPILQSCKSANIAVRIDIMIGFPTETDKEAKKTYNFIQNNKDIIDTPFSSYPVAIFELREEIPVMNQLEKLNITPLQLTRGDLDEQYDFIENGSTQIDKEYWRAKLIKYFKTEMNAELIVPNNKTHQLILKDKFDKGIVSLPVTQITETLLKQIQIGNDVNIISNGKLQLQNLSNDGYIELDNSLNELVNLLKEGIKISEIKTALNFDFKIILKLLNFLYRESFISLK